jgi:platelet-activating factor acetylhydrolase IB subunit beta/gamma
MKNYLIYLLLFIAFAATCAIGVEFPANGWPISEEEHAYILSPVAERRPADAKQWPVTPVAGQLGTNIETWLQWHTKLVDAVNAQSGPLDILLVGDSITQRWGSPIRNQPLSEIWRSRFGKYETLNLGLGGDRTPFVLWRLNHSNLHRIQPRLIILLIGVNNVFQMKDTGAPAIAQGMVACIRSLREKCPQSKILVLTIFPADCSGARLPDIQRVNRELLRLKPDSDPMVTLVDLHEKFLKPDGTLNEVLYLKDRIHLSDAGYGVYADALKPWVESGLEQ